MTLFYFGFGLMTVAAITAWIINLRLLRRIRNITDDHKILYDLSHELMDFKTFAEVSYLLDATVEEKISALHSFEVVRKLEGNRLCVYRVDYDPKDAEDREYKRILAQECADALNEKP